ncbi:MAG TPA: hypothetical protein DD420_20070 [Streptomyces sp.]|nr:hypothetical protein [Streptomyces sp.]
MRCGACGRHRSRPHRSALRLPVGSTRPSGRRHPRNGRRRPAGRAPRRLRPPARRRPGRGHRRARRRPRPVRPRLPGPAR